MLGVSFLFFPRFLCFESSRLPRALLIGGFRMVSGWAKVRLLQTWKAKLLLARLTLQSPGSGWKSCKFSVFCRLLLPKSFPRLLEGVSPTPFTLTCLGVPLDGDVRTTQQKC